MEQLRWVYSTLRQHPLMQFVPSTIRRVSQSRRTLGRAERLDQRSGIGDGRLPYYKNYNKDCRQYNFTMNGLTFDLFFGKSLPPPYRGMCLLQSPGRPVFLAASMDPQIVQEFGGMMSTAKTVGKLA